jgi:hypothetical protein
MRDERPAGMEPVKEEGEKKRRKPYVTPEVREHGTVEEITGNLGTAGDDGTMGSYL